MTNTSVKKRSTTGADLRGLGERLPEAGCPARTAASITDRRAVSSASSALLGGLGEQRFERLARGSAGCGRTFVARQLARDVLHPLEDAWPASGSRASRSVPAAPPACGARRADGSGPAAGASRRARCGRRIRGLPAGSGAGPAGTPFRGRAPPGLTPRPGAARPPDATQLRRSARASSRPVSAGQVDQDPEQPLRLASNAERIA